MTVSLEQQLVNHTKNNERLNSLKDIFDAIKKGVKDNLSRIEETFPHYSKHDFSHSENILDYIEKILGKSRIEDLPVGDVWLILISVYLHDIGMFVTEEEKKDAWKSKEFEKFLLTCESSFDKDLQQIVKIVKGKNLGDIPLKHKDYITVLIAEFFRDRHTERSKDFINKGLQNKKLFNIDVPEELHNILECVGEIVELHSRPFVDILRQEPDFKNFPIPSCGDYHPRFVAVLLRLGDLCDVKRGRFNDEAIQKFDSLPEISSLHYFKHKTTQDTSIDEKQINMTANVSFDKIKKEKLLCKYTTDTAKEDFCQKIIHQHLKWFTSLDSEISNFKQYRDIIFPKDMKNKNIPDFKPEIIINDEPVKLSLEDLRFNFSREKAFELIEGYSLYDEPLTFIRELIQNSLDALKIQMWRDLNKEGHKFYEMIPDEKRKKKDTLAPFDFIDNKKLYSDYRIVISVKYNKDKKSAEIIFKDNGIGITQEDIHNKIIRTGTSWHGNTYQEELASMPAWLRPTGSFGIGLHSVFAVTDRFRIETFSEKEDKGNIVVLHTGRTDGFVFSRPDKTINKRGTSVILELNEEKISQIFSQNSRQNPYEGQSRNNVLESLREYIGKNIICPLFDVYLFDANIADKEQDKPFVSKLCDNETYSYMFNSNIRNRFFNMCNSEYQSEEYDIAITNYKSLRFLLWDRKNYAMYEIGRDYSDERPSHFSSFYDEKSSYRNVTYMGIALKEQPLDSLRKCPLNIHRIEFTAGDSKKDITADRTRLKQEKLDIINNYLHQSKLSVALFGQSLFANVMQNETIQRFFEKTKETAEHLNLEKIIKPDIHSDLKYILKNKEPDEMEISLYSILVFRHILKNNLNIFRQRFTEIANSLNCLEKDKAIIYQQFASSWFKDPLFNNFFRILLFLSSVDAKIIEYYTDFSEGFGAEFCCAIKCINEKMFNMTYEKGKDEYEKDVKSYISEEKKDSEIFRNEFSKIFVENFGSVEDILLNEFATEFATKFSDSFFNGLEFKSNFYDKKHMNGYHTYGKAFYIRFNSQSNIIINGKKKQPQVEKILNDEEQPIYLLMNDDWEWVLWELIKNNLPICNLLRDAGDYFALLPGHDYGYGFDDCNTIIDLFSKNSLSCSINNLSYKLYDIPDLIYNIYYWKRMEWDGQTFMVTLERTKKNNGYAQIIAENETIQKWWKIIKFCKSDRDDFWRHNMVNTSPCFEKYSSICVHDVYNSKPIYLNDDRIKIFHNNSVLIFPEKINDTELLLFVQNAENIDVVVADIMNCEQTKNIINYIYHERTSRDILCTPDEIKEGYEQLIRDYVEAVKDM